MKRLLQVVAALIAIAGLSTWLATGAHRGWTRTTAPKRTVDEVTGIEGVTYERRFVMGVDLLAATSSAAVLLAGVSFFFRSKQHVEQQTTTQHSH